MITRDEIQTKSWQKEMCEARCGKHLEAEIGGGNQTGPYLTSRVDNVEPKLLTLVADNLGERVLDRGIVRVDKVRVDELDTERRFACRPDRGTSFSHLVPGAVFRALLTPLPVDRTPLSRVVPERSAPRPRWHVGDSPRLARVEGLRSTA